MFNNRILVPCWIDFEGLDRLEFILEPPWYPKGASVRSKMPFIKDLDCKWGANGQKSFLGPQVNDELPKVYGCLTALRALFKGN